MQFDEINFNRQKVLENISRFFHYGINFDRDYKKREIIEGAINKTHEKLIEALRFGGTHTHKQNMIYTFKRLIELYELAFIHDSIYSDYYNGCLAEICLSIFKEHEGLIETIYKIINNGFSHREQDILLRPYLFDFENWCSIRFGHHYKDLRKKLESKLSKLVMNWIIEDQEIESIIDERVLEIIKVQNEIKES